MVKFKNYEEHDFQEIIQEYMDNNTVQQMNDYVQHGGTTVLDHCYSVARASFILNRRLGFAADEHELITAAILHDFNLYDWHDKDSGHKWHGFNHPAVAADNAVKYCEISKREESAIRSHMWPLTITKIPQNKAGWIICMTDKYCAVCEMLQSVVMAG